MEQKKKKLQEEHKEEKKEKLEKGKLEQEKKEQKDKSKKVICILFYENVLHHNFLCVTLIKIIYDCHLLLC